MCLEFGECGVGLFVDEVFEMDVGVGVEFEGVVVVFWLWVFMELFDVLVSGFVDVKVVGDYLGGEFVVIGCQDVFM